MILCSFLRRVARDERTTHKAAKKSLSEFDSSACDYWVVNAYHRFPHLQNRSED